MLLRHLAMDQSDRLYLRQQFPLLDFDKPFVIGGCKPELQEFLQQYGYVQLLECTPCEYYAGQAKLGGFRCVAHCWEPPREEGVASKTAIIAHGLFDHTGLYLKLVRALLNAGITVFAIDLPGHGISEGEPASIECFDEYANVIADSVLLLGQWPSRFGTISLIGQSTGAAVVLWYLLDQVYQSNIHRVVLLAPLMRPVRYHLIQWLFPLAKLMGVTPKRRFTQNSSDLDFCRFLENDDELQAHHIPRRWISAMLDWVVWFERRCQNCDDKSNKLEVPLLVVQGDLDQVVDWRYNLPCITRIFKQFDTVTVTGARHHLVNESKALRQKIFSPIVKFLE